MKQPAAPTSLAIKVITAIVFVLDAGFYVATLWQRSFLVPAVFLTVMILLCFVFWTPIAYELKDNELTVSFRIGHARYRPVVKCSMLETPLSCSIRLFGNGGLFAGSGIFWNRQLGVFRAYVTTSKPATMVLVETSKKKIVISPADPPAWLTAQ